jgi:hypothetical protein
MGDSRRPREFPGPSASVFKGNAPPSPVLGYMQMLVLNQKMRMVGKALCQTP